MVSGVQVSGSLSPIGQTLHSKVFVKPALPTADFRQDIKRAAALSGLFLQAQQE
jgi:hypothetical protein